MAGTIFNDINFQGITNAGLVAALGTLKFTFTSSGLDAVTYQDSLLTIANPNPIVLSSSGKADVFLLNGTYDIVLKDSDDVVIKSITDFTIDSQGIGAQVLANTAAIAVNAQSIIDNKAYTNRAVYSPYDEFTAVGGETAVTTTDNTELELYKNGTLLILTTDYTINGDGLTIDLTAPLALNDLVTWYRLARSFLPLRRKDLSILITPATDVDYTLTAIENQYGRIEIDTTNWTIARNIIMNNAEHTFLAVVNTTGSEAATFKNTTGTGISVGTGEAKELRNDTINVDSEVSGGGKLLQLLNVEFSTQSDFSTGSFVDTGLTLSITPTSATSKILINFDIQGEIRSSPTSFAVQLVRDAVNIYTGITEEIRIQDSSNRVKNSWTKLDSPASASSLTYKVQIKMTTGTFRLCESSNIITMTLSEIGA